MSKTILVIDDDKLVVASLSESLSVVGFQVEAAEDGQAGLAKALAIHPDLVVTDLRMPVMDGIEMIEKLRVDDWGKQVPVIVLSADEKTVTINQALSAGVTQYLSKSMLAPDEIAQEIKQALN